MNQSYYFTIFFFIIFVLACADEDPDFSECNRNFSCGELADIGYPFWGNDRPEKCGYPLFKLECSENSNTTISINQLEYRVDDINSSSHTIKISRNREICSPPPPFVDETLAVPFNYSSTVRNLTLFYNCTSNPFFNNSPSHSPLCSVSGRERDLVYAGWVNDDAGFNNSACKEKVDVPVEDEVLVELFDKAVVNLSEALKEPFGVNYYREIRKNDPTQ